MTAAALPMVVPPMRLVAGFALSAAAAEAADTDPQTIVRRWLEAKSTTARRAYSRSLRQFTQWAVGADVAPETGMRVLCEAGVGAATTMVEKWRDELLQSGLAPGTVSGAVTALASLVTCCRRAGLVSWAIEGVAPRAERRQDRSGPRRVDMVRLIEFIDAAAEAGDRQAIRDSAVVRLLYCCGLRRSEAGQLGLEDVDLSAGVVMPRRKGRREKERTTISSGTAKALSRWIEARGTNPGPLFYGCRRDGDPSKALSGESIRRLLRRWSKAAGVKVPVRPHGLRHAGATEVACRGSLASLMAFGAWRSLSSASQYLDKREQERSAALDLVDV